MATKRAKGGGRKAIAAEKRLGADLSLRIRPDLRAALEQAAERSGRKLNAEVRARLERSLSDELATKGLSAYGRRARAVGILAARLCEFIEQPISLSWREDLYTARALAAGLVKLIQMLEPPGAVKKPAGAENYLDKDEDENAADPAEFGRLFAKLLHANVMQMLTPPYDQVRQDLGIDSKELFPTDEENEQMDRDEVAVVKHLRKVTAPKE